MKEQHTLLRPDFLFEVSWEVCNKTSGIHTVISTKVPYVESELGPSYIVVGPDIHKEHHVNDSFREDSGLFTPWVQLARENGLNLRVGRWNIPGSPIAILVDFSHYLTQKDKIFAEMWETYQLDSISGGWDYVEPALFGYAAGKVIEHFYQSRISGHDKLIVHCHEWKTGMTLLYLKKMVPQAGLVFTNHDTVAGRTIANAGIPLYNSIEIPNLYELLDKYGQRAKHSLELLAASKCDCHTSVSEIGSNETARFYLKPPCAVTPNGFDGSLMPDVNTLEEFRASHKLQVSDFIAAFFGKKPSDHALFVIHSGRYEMHGKGIDVFIDALAQLNNSQDGPEIYAVISVLANHSGPIQEVKDRIDSPSIGSPVYLQHLTHYVLSEGADEIMQRLKAKGLNNSEHNRVKVIFIPAWLDGKDGIINMQYYDFLAGFDLGIFPSYYEPWGYTPMESLAFGVPAVTTSLTGFGIWAKTNHPGNKALVILERNDENEQQFTNELSHVIEQFGAKDASEMKNLWFDALSLAGNSLWAQFIRFYRDVYEVALTKTEERFELYKNKQSASISSSIHHSSPNWYKVLIKPYFPDNLLPLKELSQNLWWSWDIEAQELFSVINPQLWEKSGFNPVALLEMLEIKQIRQLEQDPEFIARLNSVHLRFKEYISAAPIAKKKIAYFCMEYGLHASVKLYSGGLGILAGDYLKEASDMNQNFIAVGLLYRYGYFNQKISPFGDQISERIPQKFTHLPIKPVRNDQDEWIHVTISFPGRMVKAKVWVLQVGRIPLYLLDTDIDENSASDRSITHQLYGGDWENRLKQELLLGIGGIRMLRKLNIHPDLFHLNEGHAAFLNLERMRFLIQDLKLNFNQAVEVLRSSSLFTTHTPVPAGHDAFDEGMLRAYLAHYPDRFNISWEQFVGLGRMHPQQGHEKFSMSVLALNLSQECNGVSRLHGRVSQEMFTEMYPGYFSDENHISYVTNGVHYSTWTATEWQNLLTGNNPSKLDSCLNDKDKWAHLYDVPDEKIWEIRNKYRNILTGFISEKLVKDYTARQEHPKMLMDTLDNIKTDVLTIGFARRFATYKRAHLLFINQERLSRIVNDPLRPVRFIFAGKAHPHDTLGQELIKKIITWSKLPQFVGKVLFLDNYDAEIAKKMVQGVDVWLNTPTRPLEASGTSGQKCVMNGVLHFSVLDGWWAEGYVPKAGWALKEARTYNDQKLQDDLDAETLYSILESDIIPTFYKRNSKNIPCEWIQIIKKNLCEVAPVFTTRRMMNDYYDQFYNTMLPRHESLCAETFSKACVVSAWKRKTQLLWENVRVVENRCHNSTVTPLNLGEDFHAELLIDTAGIDPEDIGVELLFGQKIMDRIDNIMFTEELFLKEVHDNVATFERKIEIRRAGVLDFAVRIFAKNIDLPHRTDFPLVKWG